MKISETPIHGAFVIDIDRKTDDRGFFARVWCKDYFEKNRLEFNFIQNSISFNAKKGTLRGLHYQIPPSEEVKIVNCVAGSVFDVIVDLRETSSTFRRTFSVNLSFKNGRMLYIPKGVAHGFQTLTDNTALYYMISSQYDNACSRGIRWNDPCLGIKWPEADNRIISIADQRRPFLQ